MWTLEITKELTQRCAGLASRDMGSRFALAFTLLAVIAATLTYEPSRAALLNPDDSISEGSRFGVSVGESLSTSIETLEKRGFSSPSMTTEIVRVRSDMIPFQCHPRYEGLAVCPTVKRFRFQDRRWLGGEVWLIVRDQTVSGIAWCYEALSRANCGRVFEYVRE